MVQTAPHLSHPYPYTLSKNITPKKYTHTHTNTTTATTTRPDSIIDADGTAIGASQKQGYIIR